MARNFGLRPSRLLPIRCEMTAFDFDRAANYRLIKFDGERETNRKKDEAQLINQAVALAFAGEPLTFEDEGNDLTDDLSQIPVYE